jgi:hypothetical protein
MIDRQVFKFPRLITFGLWKLIEPIPFRVQLIGKLSFVLSGLFPGSGMGRTTRGTLALWSFPVCFYLQLQFIALIGCVALFSAKDPQWLQTLVTWIGNAFLFTAGIAVGKSTKSDK